MQRRDRGLMINDRVRSWADILACGRPGFNAQLAKNAKIAKEGGFRAVAQGTLHLRRHGDTSIDPTDLRSKAH